MKYLKLLTIIILLNLSLAVKANAQSDIETTPAPTPAGQVIKLDFRIPGIGSASGNLKPLHPTRSVLLSFYATDVNSEDKSVKPLERVITSATYDSDESSPTFGEYVNPNIDLGQQVPDGTYQISFQVNNSLPSLVKETDTDIAGKKFDIKNLYSQDITISGQTVVTGDIYPQGVGDNTIDINDYKVLTGCFGKKLDSPTCTDKNAADLNDDGVIDGTDYNIIYSSFKKLLDRGLPVPTELFPNQKSNTKKVTNTKQSPKPKPTSKKVTPKKGSFLALILLILFVLIIAAFLLVFLLKRKKPLNFDKKLAEKQGVLDQAAGPALDGNVEKEFFIKKQTVDTNGTNVLTLTDDSGPMLGYYKDDVQDGFAKVKGVIKKEGSKVFMDISEIKPETETKPQD